MIGSSMATRHLEHMSIDVFFNKFKKKLRSWLEIAGSLAVMCLVVYVIVYGFKFLSITKTQISSGTGIPVSYIYLSIPVGFILMLLYLSEILIKLLMTKRRDS